MDARKTLEDAAYITVGVGVIAFQQAQVRRREVQATLEKHAQETKTFIEHRAQDGRTKLESLTKDVSGRVEPLVGDLRERVEPLVEQLQSVPVQVNQVVEAGTTKAKDVVNRAA
jgi:gas vesicle protein